MKTSKKRLWFVESGDGGSRERSVYTEYRDALALVTHLRRLGDKIYQGPRPVKGREAEEAGLAGFRSSPGLKGKVALLP